MADEELEIKNWDKNSQKKLCDFRLNSPQKKVEVDGEGGEEGRRIGEWMR